MFAGIVEAVGALSRVERAPFGARLRVLVPKDWTLARGESVAVNGVCLSVTGSRPGEASFDAAPATFEKTTLPLWRAPRPVNLERALRADSRLGGHWVTGHVGGTALLQRRRPAGGAWVWELEAPAGPAARLVPEGSVTLDGVSLTVSALRGLRFEVVLIPQTLESTALGALREGSRLNLETDVLSKAPPPAAAGGVSEEFLRANGFLP